MTDLYITKYALTSGIAVRKQVEIQANMAIVEHPDGLNGLAFYHGKEWHVTKEAALRDAESRRAKKIASLRKQIAKLEKLQFVID